jgi:hypothetical protein
VDISINNPLAHLRTRPASGFFGRSVARMKSFLTDDAKDKRAEAHERKFIGIDANIDLPMHKPIAQLGAGELFGEMTCRTFQPRSATVITREPCVMVEMLRVILDMLVGNRQVSDASKATSRGPPSKWRWRKNIASVRSKPISAAFRFLPQSATNSLPISKKRLSWCRSIRTRSSAKKAMRQTRFT